MLYLLFVIAIASVPAYAVTRRLVGGPVAKWEAVSWSFLAGAPLAILALWPLSMPWWAQVICVSVFAGAGAAHFTNDHAANWEEPWKGLVRFSTFPAMTALMIASAALAGWVTTSSSFPALPLLGAFVLALNGISSAAAYWFAKKLQSPLDALPGKWKLPNGSWMLKGWTSYAELGYGAVYAIHYSLAMGCIALYFAGASHG